MAFYGLGGDNDEMSKPFHYDSNYFRPKGYDCTIHGKFYDFVSSMSRKQKPDFVFESNFNSIFFSIMTFP